MIRTMRMAPVLRLNLALSAGVFAASWALLSPRFAGSVALGALLEAANFRALFRSSELFFQGGGARRPGFGLRLVLLGAAVAVALFVGAQPIGLVVGLSLIVPSIVVVAWRVRPEDGPTLPAPPPDDESWDAWNPWLARERELVDPDDEVRA